MHSQHFTVLLIDPWQIFDNHLQMIGCFLPLNHFLYGFFAFLSGGRFG